MKNGSNYEYQYAITDRQGNTRVVFSSVAPAPQPTLADFDGDANDQSIQFTNVPTPVNYAAANNTTGGSKVVVMNQGNPVGPSLSKKVFPGDKVDMEVYSYHEATSGYGTTNLNNLATLVAAAFVSSTGGVDMGGAKSGGVNSAFTNFGAGANMGDAQPAAYLNYILFDQNYSVMDAGWQVVPATSFSKQKVSIPTVSIKVPGYIFVYLSYEDQSNNYVYFDDFKVTVTPNNVVQSNEYYAFNSSAMNSWTRDNAVMNNFLANEGTEVNPTTSLYDLDYRNFDPILGRMNGVDLEADKYSFISPYNFSLNNPIIFTDPTGADPCTFCNANDVYIGPTLNVMDGAGGGGAPWYGNSSNDGGNGFYGDASKVLSGEMSLEEYAAKYGDVYITSPAGGGFEIGNEGYNPEEGWVIDLVRAQDVLDKDPENQNANYRDRAYAALHPGSSASGDSFWGPIAKGFGQYGQAWADMFNGAYTYLTPNVYRMGTGPANGQGGPPPRPGRRSVWVDWDIMTMSLLGISQLPAQKGPTQETFREMTTDKNDIDALDAWSPTNTDSSLGPKTPAIQYYPNPFPIGGYDSSFMKVGNMWVPSGIPKR